MALTATIYTFDIQLSDVDRNVYETLAIRAACQPSETAEHLVTRVLAYCLEYREGIAFSRGIAEADTPAVFVKDLTGTLLTWIDIGAPDAARLHKASKAASRVAVYTHRDADRLVEQLSGQKIHRAAAIDVRGFDREMLASIVEHLDRRNTWTVSMTEEHLYITIGTDTIEGDVTRYALTA